MKLRVLSVLLSVFLFVPAVLAQDTPATREEIIELLDLMQIRDSTRQAMHAATSQALAQFRSMPGLRDAGLPAGTLARFEERLNTILDDMIAEYPVDEILEDVVPIYQKHLTSTDAKAMIAFYSTPTGQKVIRDMPSIMAESMQVAQPRVQRQTRPAEGERDVGLGRLAGGQLGTHDRLDHLAAT